MRRLNPIRYALAAAPVLFGLLALSPQRPPRPAGAALSDARAEGPARSATRSPRRAGQRDNIARYRFELTNAVDLPETPGTRDITIDARGTLELAIAPSHGEQTLLRGRFSQVSVVVQQPDKGARSKAGAVETEAELALALAPGGQIERVYLDGTGSAMAESLYRQVLSAWQRKLAPVADARQWSAQEEDAHGVCEVAYERAGEQTLFRRKQKCQPRSAAGGLELAREVTGTTRYELTPHPLWIARATSDEQLAVETNAEPVRAVLRVALNLTSLEEGTVEPIDLAPMLATRLSTEPTAAEPARAPLRPGLTPAEVLARVRGDDSLLMRNAQETLAQLFAERPEEIAKARALMEETKDPHAQMVVLGALADTDSRASQHALIDIARSQRVDPDKRNSALLGFIASRQPAPETLQELQQLADDSQADVAQRELALMMLGTTARAAAGSEQSAEAAQATVALLEQRVTSAADDQQRALYLDALGNSGAESALEVTTNALGADSEQVRASAVDALRRLQSPEASELIGKTITSDPSDNVRQRAISALVHRELDDTTQAALVAAARSDESEPVRIEALSLLGRRQTRPGVVEVLREVAASDPSERARKIAQQSLDSRRGSKG